MATATITIPGIYPQLPVFVYGTLRRGEANHRVIRPFTCGIHPAVLPQHRLYVQGLPYIAAGDPADRVVGDLVSLDPDLYEIGMKRLDQLEGIAHGFYVRRAVIVGFTCGSAPRETCAWVYLGGSGFDFDPHLIAPDGDFISRSDHRVSTCA